MFCKKGVLRNFAKFTGKYQRWSLFFIKVAGCARASFLIKLQASTCNFIKNEILAQVFACGFCKISKNAFSYRTLRWLLLIVNVTCKSSIFDQEFWSRFCKNNNEQNQSMHHRGQPVYFYMSLAIFSWTFFLIWSFINFRFCFSLFSYFKYEIIENLSGCLWSFYCRVWNHKKQPREVFYKKWCSPVASSKKGIWHRCFPINFAKILKNIFFPEYIRAIASESFCTLLAIILHIISGGVLQKRCSWKFHKIHRKAPVPESLFNRGEGLRLATLLKKRLWHRCFPVNFVKHLRIPFL